MIRGPSFAIFTGVTDPYGFSVAVPTALAPGRSLESSQDCEA